MSNKWGPSLWVYLHYQAKFYPKNPTAADIRNMRAFLTSVGKTLPCKICRTHFDRLLKRGGTYHKIKIPPLSDNVLMSQKSYFVWLYHVHNYVTVHKKREFIPKKIILPRYQDVIKMY